MSSEEAGTTKWAQMQEDVLVWKSCSILWWKLYLHQGALFVEKVCLVPIWDVFVYACDGMAIAFK